MATKDESIIEEALEAFEDIENAENDNRLAWKSDVDFSRLENQWPLKIRQQRETDARPCLTINKLAAFIRQVVNDARQNKPQPTVHPVDSQGDPQVAQIFNGIIRNIYATSDADVAHDTAVEHAVSGGFGYWRINTQYTSDDTFDQDLTISRIANPLSVYGDHNSTAADSSDWDVAFIVDTLTQDQFETRYKGAEKVDWSNDYASVKAPWCDGENVMIAEYWTRDDVKKRIVALSNGEIIAEDEYAKLKALFDAQGITVVGDGREVSSKRVTQRIMSGVEILDTVSWAGKYIPIVPVYGDEVNYEGKRHLRSLIRSAMDAQRRYNYHQSTVTELVALAPKAPWIGPEGFADADGRWDTANTESHPFLEYKGAIAPQRQPFAGVPAGEMQAALNASDDMKAIIGIYDPSLGARSNETSGVAINARKVESDNSTFHFMDNLSRAIRHEGRILIDLIPKVISPERIARTIGADGTIGMAHITDEGPALQGRQQPDGSTLQVYNLSAGKYDLTVKAGPAFSTQREAAVEALTEIGRAYPPAMPVLADLIVKNMDIPGGDEAVKRLQGMAGAPQGVDPKQVQAMQQQGQAMQQQLGQMAQENQQLKQQLALAQADLETKRTKNEIDGFKAQTDRMEAVHTITQPPQVSESPRSYGQ